LFPSDAFSAKRDVLDSQIDDAHTMNLRDARATPR
jgi:hypothetical protein